MTSRELWSRTYSADARMREKDSPWRHGRVGEFAIVFTAFVFLYLTKGIAAVSSDGEALLAFKAVLQDPTGILRSWNAADPTPCLWEGVTCNTNLKVQRLLLQKTQLSGPIAGAALRSLSELRTVVLARNNFSGALPTELSQIGSSNSLPENHLSHALVEFSPWLMNGVSLSVCSDPVET